MNPMNMDGQSYFSIDRSKYLRLMAENLPVLRTKLGISQTELAEIIGVTRQTISSAERGSRELSWPHFLSLLCFFTQNKATAPLMPALGIYTEELAQQFQVTNLTRFQTKEPKGEGE